MEGRLVALENRQDFLENEMAGISRVITLMEKTIASHEEVLNKNGIGELRSCVGELKTLLYGDERVGAPGMITQFKHSEDRVKELVAQRDKLVYILIGIGIAMAGQTGLLIAFVDRVSKAFGV